MHFLFFVVIFSRYNLIWNLDLSILKRKYIYIFFVEFFLRMKKSLVRVFYNVKFLLFLYPLLENALFAKCMSIEKIEWLSRILVQYTSRVRTDVDHNKCNFLRQIAILCRVEIYKIGRCCNQGMNYSTFFCNILRLDLERVLVRRCYKMQQREIRVGGCMIDRATITINYIIQIAKFTSDRQQTMYIVQIFCYVISTYSILSHCLFHREENRYT